MTGLARYPGQVIVDTALAVRFLLMTRSALKVIKSAGRDDEGVALDMVIVGVVAGLAAHVLSLGGHVDIQSYWRIQKGAVEVTVLDPIPTAAIEMA
jgi:hypothetical protein